MGGGELKTRRAFRRRIWITITYLLQVSIISAFKFPDKTKNVKVFGLEVINLTIEIYIHFFLDSKFLELFFLYICMIKILNKTIVHIFYKKFCKRRTSTSNGCGILLEICQTCWVGGLLSLIKYLIIFSQYFFKYFSALFSLSLLSESLV